MHLPTLCADLSALLSRSLLDGRARRARFATVLTASALGCGALVAGCREDPQPDSAAPTLAPSAPPGMQSKPLGKCLPPSAFATFVSVPEDFPLCVAGVYAVADRTGADESPLVFAYGAPVWEESEKFSGPVTGATCTKAQADSTDNPCKTAQDLWTVPSGPDGVASPGSNALAAEPVPSPSNWMATYRLTLEGLPFSVFAHRSDQPGEPGEVIILNDADRSARASVNALGGLAYPPQATLATTFYYTGSSALYVNDVPTKAEPGLYRATCQVQKTSSRTCTSARIATWGEFDTPGAIASDVDGNVVAAREVTAGTQATVFAAGALGGASEGTSAPAEPFNTTSLTLIGGKGKPSYVVAVKESGAGVPEPITLQPVTISGTTVTLGPPSQQGITLGTGLPFTNPDIEGSPEVTRSPVVRVFHDGAGELWMAVSVDPPLSKKSNALNVQPARAAFLRFATRD